MALQVSGVAGVRSGAFPGRADGPALRGGAGRADGGDGPAVVQHRAPAQDRVDRGAVGAGLGDGGEQQHGAALAGYGAVGVRVVGAAPPAVRDQFGHGRGLLGRQAARAQAHPAGQGVPGIAGGEFAAGVVDRGQRAVAAGVHGVAGAGQTEDVGDAGRGAERHVAERAERPGVARGGPVGGGRGGEDDGGARVGQVAGGVTGVLHGLVGEEQGEPLLGVHQSGLATGEPEQAVVEGVDVPQVAHGQVGRRRVEAGRLGAALRERADAVAPGQEVGAELREVVGVGEPQRQPHHGHGVVGDLRAVGCGAVRASGPPRRRVLVVPHCLPRCWAHRWWGSP